MNVHSHIERGTAETRDAAAVRHGVILDAFERCIAHTGMHQTSMQDVARAAGMSAGNLYRYFPSKEALIVGVVERDRERVVRDFESFAEEVPIIEIFAAVGRKYFVDDPRSRAIQCLETWAESTRNAAVFKVCRDIDDQVRGIVLRLIERGKARGEVAPQIDPCTALGTLFLFTDGLFARKAFDPTFNADAGFRMFIHLVALVLKGAIDLGSAGTLMDGAMPDAAMPAAI